MNFRLPFRPQTLLRSLLLASSCFSVVSVLTLLEAKPANAWFKVCNQSTEKVDVAFAYTAGGGKWMSEGWWILRSGDCATVYGGELTNRYYYVYAKGNAGGVWTGNNNFCVISDKFLIGFADTRCSGNGRWEKFNQVDTGDSKNWTYNLTE
jgi:uncharacterized membrane protein